MYIYIYIFDHLHMGWAYIIFVKNINKADCGFLWLVTSFVHTAARSRRKQASLMILAVFRLCCQDNLIQERGYSVLYTDPLCYINRAGDNRNQIQVYVTYTYSKPLLYKRFLFLFTCGYTISSLCLNAIHLPVLFKASYWWLNGIIFIKSTYIEPQQATTIFRLFS